MVGVGLEREAREGLVITVRQVWNINAKQNEAQNDRCGKRCGGREGRGGDCAYI